MSDGQTKQDGSGASLSTSPPRLCSEFPEGFTGDMEALHKHHQTQLAAARAWVETAKTEVERWEKLEEASSRLAVIAMHKRWSEESHTQNNRISKQDH